MIERVLAEFDQQGLAVKIDRLDLRLGTIPAERLDLAIGRLEAALREALFKAFNNGVTVPVSNGRTGLADEISIGAAPAGAALLHALTQYLLYGIWPYQEASAENPLASLSDLLARDPASFLEIIRRHWTRPEFIGRLAMQMSFDDLERTLILIEPENADAIRIIMRKLRAPGREPLASHSHISMDRKLWQLTLRHALSSAGAVFDPVSFEQRLLRGIAAAQATDDSTKSHRTIPSDAGTDSHAARDATSAISLSAPAIAAAETADDIPRDENTQPTSLELLELFLVHGTLRDDHPDALLIEAAVEYPDALSRLLRRHANNPAMLWRMVNVMSPDALGKLLFLLTPEAASIIIALMLEARGLSRVVVPLRENSLEKLLWFVALRYVLIEAGTQFNRRQFVESMIAGIANSERVTYHELLSAFYLSVAEVAKAVPVPTSLPAIIIELARSVEPTEPQSDPLLEIKRTVGQARHQLSAAELIRSLKSAGHIDPNGLRELLLPLALRDPDLLLRTAGVALSKPTLIALMFPQEHARHAAALMRRLDSWPVGGDVPRHKLYVAIVGAIAASDRSEPDRLFSNIFQAVAALSNVAPETIASLLKDWPEEGEPSNRTASEEFAELATATRAEPDHGPDPTLETDIAKLVAGYGNLDRLRHLLVTGVLPWRDILDEPQLTSLHVIESLKRLRPGMVRAALMKASLHHSDVRCAVDGMPEATAVALIHLLLPPDSSQALIQSVTDHTAQAADRQSFQTRLILALVKGHALDFETWTAADGYRAVNVSKAIASTQFTNTALAALSEGVGGRSGIETNVQWIETLERLSASNMRAARRFHATVARSPAALACLTDLCVSPLLDRVFVALLPAAAGTLTVLARALIVEGQRYGIHRHEIVAAFLVETATIDADAAAGPGLIMRLLRRVFGERLPPWLASTLRRDLLPHLPHELGKGLSVMLAASQKRVSTEASAGLHNSPSSRRRIPQILEFNVQQHEGLVGSGNAASSEVAAGQHAEWLFRALADTDLSRAAARYEVPELLFELMNELLEAPSRDLAMQLVAFLAKARNSSHLIRLLPERLLARLTILAAPETGSSLLETSEVLAVALGAAGYAMDRSAMWQELFTTIGAPVGERTVAALSERFFAIAGRALGDQDPVRREAAGAGLLREAALRARDAGLSALVATIEQRPRNLVAAYRNARHPFAGRAAAVPASSHRELRTPAPFKMATNQVGVSGEPIYVDNAGLVLANPFLPHLFDRLDMLVRDDAGKPRLRDEATASRAVHLLQYLVDGHTDRPEPRLALNKLLCGMPIAAPVERAIDATALEQETCDSLLRSMVENWPILRNTSTAGLRETFLQREGKLTYGDAGWRLQVQRKTLDVLVDQVPWSIGVVFHPWMPGPLHVTW